MLVLIAHDLKSETKVLIPSLAVKMFNERTACNTIPYKVSGEHISATLKCSPNAHCFFGKTCIFWHFRANKKACKRLIYRLLVVFDIAFSGMDGTRTRDPMRDRHVF